MNRAINKFRFVSIFAGIVIILFFVGYDYLRGNADDGLGLIQQFGILFGVVLIISSLINSFWHYVFLSVFLLGVFLLCANIYGEGISLRNPKVNSGNSFYNKFRTPQLTTEQVFDQISLRQNETHDEYAFRLTNLVYSATIHKWEDVVDPSEYNHRVPFHENYILWVLSYLKPETYQRYHFCDPHKAIERGVMICSQATGVMVSLWKEQTNLRARNMVLDGHVVAEAEVDHEKNIWWILDADFGVVLKHNLAELEKHPELVVESYVNAGYDINIAETLAEIYGKDGNYRQVNVDVCRTEQRIYSWKWALPVSLLAISSIYFGCLWLIRWRNSSLT